MNTIWDRVIGHKKIVKHLATLASKQRFPSNLLFTGKKGIGKMLVVDTFINAVLNKDGNTALLKRIDEHSHPDVTYLIPEGKSQLHTVSQIEELIEESAKPPLEGAYRFFVIERAEAMLPVQSNRLLKVLEDAPPSHIFLLIAHDKKQLLPTIFSRMVEIPFKPLGANEIQYALASLGYQVDISDAPVRLSYGSLSEAIKVVTQRVDELDQALDHMMESLASHNWLTFYQQLDFIDQKVNKISDDERKLLTEKQLYDRLFLWLESCLHRRWVLDPKSDHKNQVISNLNQIFKKGFPKLLDGLKRAYGAMKIHFKSKTVLEYIIYTILT